MIRIALVLSMLTMTACYQQLEEGKCIRVFGRIYKVIEVNETADSALVADQFGEEKSYWSSSAPREDIIECKNTNP